MKNYINRSLLMVLTFSSLHGMEGAWEKEESEVSPQSKSMIIDREFNIIKTMRGNSEAHHEPCILDYLFGKNKCRFIWVLMSNGKFRNSDAYPLMQKVGLEGKKESEEMLGELFHAIRITRHEEADLKILQIKRLINQGVDLECQYAICVFGSITPLHWAAENQNISAIQLILDQGVSPNIKDGDHRTPLWNAIFRGVKKGDLEAAEFLLKKGSDINARDRIKRTLLHYFIRFKSMVEFLINHNADIALKDYNGDTVLHRVINSFSGSKGKEALSMIDCLLKAGADIFAKNNDGKTPLDLAKKNDVDPALIAHLVEEEEKARERI